MKTKLGIYLWPCGGSSGFVEFLPMAAPPVGTSEIVVATENATTRRAHEGLVKYYEETAAQIQAKLEKKRTAGAL